MKFLVIRLSSIGDIVLTTPVIRCLKNQLQGVALHYLTEPAFKPVIAHNPYIDRIHTAGEPGLISQLKNENLDYKIAKQNFKIGSILPIEWVWIKNPWMKIEK